MAEKAEIHLLDKQGNRTSSEPIKVMYNPTDYTFSEGASLKKTKAGQLQFQKMERGTLTVKLLFDTYEKRTDVRDETYKIANLLRPSVGGQEKNRPNICLFAWGGFTYKGVITKVDQKFILFLDSGIPVRAELTVTFTSFESQEDLKKQLGLDACRKLWTVKTGDRLDLIAHAALLDARQWRKIAELNDIIDPLAFPQAEDIGKNIIIPDIS
jgi:nucleoid-associated protein YgaU